MEKISKKAWERQLKTALSKMGTAWLDANLKEWSNYIDPCLTADQFVKMSSATRFGGDQNAIQLGGSQFLIQK